MTPYAGFIDLDKWDKGAWVRRGWFGLDDTPESAMVKAEMNATKTKAIYRRAMHAYQPKLTATIAAYRHAATPVQKRQAMRAFLDITAAAPTPPWVVKNGR